MTQKNAAPKNVMKVRNAPLSFSGETLPKISMTENAKTPSARSILL